MTESRVSAEPLNTLKSDAEFFAAIRFLQVLSNRRIGDDTNVDDEPLRLAAKPAIDYASTEVASIAQRADGSTVAEVSFFGLHGPSGALPQHYTQTVIDRIRAKDHTLRNFLDLFNHRWLSLFYRAWEKNFLPAAFETAQATQQEDGVTRLLWSLVGFGTDGIRGRVKFAESMLLHYSGHSSAVRPNVASLQATLADGFGVPVSIKQFQGQWMELARDDQTKLGHAPLGVLMNNQLGVNAVAGSRMWNVENRFRVVIGPLRATAFNEFTPVGNKLSKLLEFTRTFAGTHYDFDVQVILDRRDVPGLKLGDTSKPSLLGWNTWLGNWPHQHHADDAVFYEGN